MSAPEAVTHSDLEVASPVMFSNSNSNSNKSPAPVYSILQPQHDYTQAPQQDLGQGYQAVPPEKGERASNTICGVAPKIFFLLVSAIVIALAIGLGAGIGAGMAVQKSKASTTSAAATTVTVTASAATSTSTSSSTSNFSPSTLVDAVIPTNGTVALNCPSIDASNLRITLGSTVWLFSVTCGTDVLGSNQDILAVISYSLSDCAQACASYNRNYGQQKCVAATFNRNLTQSVSSNYGTCWLKNGTTGTTASTSNAYAGLKLQSS